MAEAAGNPRQALLLDFDGTLADTLPGLRRVYEDFLNELGATGQAPTFAEANGANLAELIQGLYRRHAPDADLASGWSRYWREVEAAVLASPPADGAHRLVDWARQQDWRVGIASASRTGLIAAWTKQHGLAAGIDCVVGADLCDKGKPDPAIYRLLMATMKVAPRDCIAIEDSDAGVSSAHAAGIDVIRLVQHGAGNPSDAACHRAMSLPAALNYLQQRFTTARIS
jgi:beta-phosphoglucomutase